MSAEMTRVLIADDHDLVRDGLRHALLRLDLPVEIVEAANGAEIDARLLNAAPFGLFILDLYMPDTDGLAMIRRICDRYPETPVVVLSASDSVADMQRVIEYGAAGFIPKAAGSAVLINALRLVLSGGTYIPPEMLVPRDNRVSRDGSTPYSRAPLRALVERVTGITPRQRDVLQQVVNGKTNKEIARALGLSENTVKVHMAAIFRAMGVTNRTQVLAMLQGMDLRDPTA